MTTHTTEIEYLLIESHSPAEVKRGVERAARHDFKTQGGIAVTVRDSGDRWYAQAMIRDRPAPAAIR